MKYLEAFLKKAEETGLIVPIGRAMLTKACRQLATWHALYPHPALSMSVNVSAEELGDDMRKHIEEVLKETSLEADQLSLEIAESAVLENAEAAMQMVSILQLYGVGLCLDDFGSGRSSLSDLHRFRFNTIKISRSFVSDMNDPERSERSMKFIAAIVGLARGLGIRAVAVGLENEEQARALHQLGCAYAQGFYLAEPMPFEAAGDLLRVRRG